MGDINTSLGVCEYKGHYSPSRLTMEDFLSWTNHNSVIHLSTVGAQFTWNNGKGGLAQTEKRFDMVICNSN
jgi:hypothetical protein